MMVVISLGGSLIVPEKININFLKKFRKLILDYIKKNNKVVIMCGGGRTARYYIKEVNKIKKQSSGNTYKKR